MPVSETAPAAFRRLCVETQTRAQADAFIAAQPPSGGCVLKHQAAEMPPVGLVASRLQAAVC